MLTYCRQERKRTCQYSSSSKTSSLLEVASRKPAKDQVKGWNSFGVFQIRKKHWPCKPCPKSLRDSVRSVEGNMGKEVVELGELRGDSQAVVENRNRVGQEEIVANIK